MNTLATRLTLALSAILLVLGSGCAGRPHHLDTPSGQGWQVVYANDAAGKRTAGDINVLIAAVKTGKAVRVMIDSNGEVARYDLAMLFLRNGVVSGTTPTQVSLMRDNDGSLVFKEKSYHVVNGFSTSGVYTQFSWSLPGTGWQFPGPWAGSSAMTWLAEE